MKKVSFYIVAAVAAISSIFVSCSDDESIDGPSVRFTYNGTVRESGAALTAKVGDAVDIIANYTAPGEIRQIDFKINNANVTGFPKTTGFVSKTSDEITYQTTFAEAGTVNITTMVADKQDPTMTASFMMVITVTGATTPLVDDGTFSLVYKSTSQTDGANANAAHGIRFSAITNSTTGQFIVEPSGGNNFVMLADVNAYNTITTKEALKNAYDIGTGVGSFTAQSDANFAPKYFISKVGTDYFLLRMTGLTFAPSNNVAAFASKK